MNISAHAAAKKLMAEIHAPAGLVNTMVERTKGHQRICVLVDRSYKHRLTGVPQSFLGFEVVIDVREPFAVFA